MPQIPVIDLFAGPGGLNEGFSRFQPEDGHEGFRISASFEMDPVACRTLSWRAVVRALSSSAAEESAYRAFLRSGDTAWFGRDAVRSALEVAAAEVHQLELGPSTRDVSEEAIREGLRLTLKRDEPWVLIGGPPCQAYSLVGRSRRTNDDTFADDVKHYLYREYLHIIEQFRPPVFVMENVKGLLSHRLAGRSVFDQIVDDLSAPGYEIRSFVIEGASLAPKDFVIRAEEYGIPQRRHRVILLGVRSDLSDRPTGVLRRSSAPSVGEVIGHLPAIRSRISPVRLDDPALWKEIRNTTLVWAGSKTSGREVPASVGSSHGSGFLPSGESGIENWLTNGQEVAVVQHEARGHMLTDLQRYAYFAAMAEAGEAIKVSDLPSSLRPQHSNIDRENVPFADRFRVQVAHLPSTTVVSHIAKDGHYYIHPDPAQMRSLTVREAARLQTFPDDYYFSGNRTQQYHQVGNAVPPLLAVQLAEVVYDFLRS